MTRIRHSLQAGFVAAAFVWAPSSAIAQDTNTELGTTNNAEAAEAAEPAEQAAPKRSSLALDEVVVTAQKRKEDVQDVPFSITAIGGETLREANIVDLTGLSGYLPNATIGATPTFAAIYVRGLGSSFNDGFEQSVGLYVDGIYMGRLSYLNDALIDVDRVELLRGPQGTLFGKNTVAGALSVFTAEPDYDFEGRFDYGVGDYASERFDFMVSGPLIGEVVSGRLAVQRHDAEGYIDNKERGTNEVATDKMTVKGKLRFDPAANLKIVLGLEYSEIADTGPGLEVIKASDQTQQFFGMFNEDFEGDANRITWAEGPVGAQRETKGVTLNADWEVLNHTLTYTGGFTAFDDDSLFDADTGPVPLFNWDNRDKYQQWSHELRILSEPGRFEYVAGLYAFGSTYDAFTIFSLLPSEHIDIDLLTGGQFAALGDLFASVLDPLPVGEAVFLAASDKLFQTFDQETVTYAAYGQLTGNILPWLDVIVGARVHTEEKTARIKQDFEKTGLTLGLAFNVEEYDVTETRKETNFAPKVSVRGHITEDIMVYGTIAKGFKAGGFNPFAPTPVETSFDQESSTTYETGIKTTLLDGRLTFNVGYFHTSFQDLQVAVITGVGTSFFVDNAATATSKGIEWETRFVPWLGGMVMFSGAYLDAKYGDFRKGPCQASQEPDAEGFCDLSGGALARAPKYEMSSMFNQVVPLPFWDMGVLVGIDVNFQSKHFIDADLDPYAVQGAYAIVNARLGLLDIDGAWSVTVNGQNIGDVDVRGTAQDLPLQEGTYFGLLGKPAMWNVEMRLTL